MAMRDGDPRSLLVGRLLSTSGHAIAWLGGMLMLAAAWNGYAALALREAGVVREGIVSSVSSRYSGGVRVYRPTIRFSSFGSGITSGLGSFDVGFGIRHPLVCHPENYVIYWTGCPVEG